MAIGMTEKTDDLETSPRREKYLNTLAQQEMATRQELLTRVVKRVSFYIDGQDPSLDGVLKLLRGSLQETSHRDINSVIERFDQAEPYIKQRREDVAQIVRSLLVVTVQSLQQFPLSRALKKSIDEFVVAVSQSSKREHFYIELLERLADIQQKAIEEIKQAKVGLWGKLFGGSPEEETQTIDHSLEQWVKDLDLTLRSAVNFPQLKEQLKLHLDNIRYTLNVYQQAIDANVRKGKKADVIVQQVGRRMHDLLTGLPNREQYTERLTHEYHRWKRYKRPLTIAVFEVDNFQETTEQYGEQATDKVLKIIGGSIAKRLREVDFFCRFEGEKFVALLPETQLDGAKVVLEKIRSAIARAAFNYQDESISITLSIGVTDFKKGDELESAFMRADDLLYAAKIDGMNRLHFA